MIVLLSKLISIQVLQSSAFRAIVCTKSTKSKQYLKFDSYLFSWTCTVYHVFYTEVRFCSDTNRTEVGYFLHWVNKYIQLLFSQCIQVSTGHNVLIIGDMFRHYILSQNTWQKSAQAMPVKKCRVDYVNIEYNMFCDILFVNTLLHFSFMKWK